MEKIRIVQTSDLHGYLFPTNFFEHKSIGMLSLPKEFLCADLKIDSGDLIQGSANTTYQNEYKLYEPNTIIQTINNIGYDIFTLGNHEFNYGLDFLCESLKQFNGDVIIANVKGFNCVEHKPYKIYEIKGVKIAVIGFVTISVPMFEKQEHINDIAFEDIVTTYGEYEEELKELADIIVVNYHGGFEFDFLDDNPKFVETTKENQGIELLDKYDSIDILLTGHQHQVLCERYNDTVIVQPGYAGAYYSEIEIAVDTLKIEARLVENTGVINEILVNDGITCFKDEVEEFLNQDIYKLEEDLIVENVFDLRMRGGPYSNFIHEVQLGASNADISAISIFDSTVGFSRDITMRQVIANYPFSNSLKVLKISKEDIILALEVCASYFEYVDGEVVVSERFTHPKKQHYQYDLFYGFDYEIDISKQVGKRVVYTSLEEKEYTLALSNYRATNYNWYPMYENCEVVDEVQSEMVELIINYLKTGAIESLDLKNKNFVINYKGEKI